MLSVECRVLGVEGLGIRARAESAECAGPGFSPSPGFRVRTGDSADAPDSASAHRRLAHKKYPPP